MTRRPALSLLLIAAAALPLSGCDWLRGRSSNDTRMTNVEIQPGTVSDEMVTLDDASGDGTAIDSSTATGPAAPGARSTGGETGDSADSADTTEDAASAGDEGAGGDTVIRPPAGGSSCCCGAPASADAAVTELLGKLPSHEGLSPFNIAPPIEK